MHGNCEAAGCLKMTPVPPRAWQDAYDSLALRIRGAAQRMVDSNSKIAWHRARLRKNREALKALEVARFTAGHDKSGETAKAIIELARKIAESEKCIAA